MNGVRSHLPETAAHSAWERNGDCCAIATSTKKKRVTLEMTAALTSLLKQTIGMYKMPNKK
jgi:hypothetical protein